MALSTSRIAAGSLELAGSQKPRWGLRQPGSMPAEEDAVATAAEQGGVKAAGSGQKVEHGVPRRFSGAGPQGGTAVGGGRTGPTGTPMARSCRTTSVYRVISAYGSDVHLPPSLREAVIGPNV